MLERSREKIAHCIDQGETCHTEEKGWGRERGGGGGGLGGGEWGGVGGVGWGEEVVGGGRKFKHGASS